MRDELKGRLDVVAKNKNRDCVLVEERHHTTALRVGRNLSRMETNQHSKSGEANGVCRSYSHWRKAKRTQREREGEGFVCCMHANAHPHSPDTPSPWPFPLPVIMRYGHVVSCAFDFLLRKITKVENMTHFPSVNLNRCRNNDMQTTEKDELKVIAFVLF